MKERLAANHQGGGMIGRYPQKQDRSGLQVVEHVRAHRNRRQLQGRSILEALCIVAKLLPESRRRGSRRTLNGNGPKQRIGSQAGKDKLQGALHLTDLHLEAETESIVSHRHHLSMVGGEQALLMAYLDANRTPGIAQFQAYLLHHAGQDRDVNRCDFRRLWAQAA
jgi:hypothetical protein